jgi:hypothetical protein
MCRTLLTAAIRYSVSQYQRRSFDHAVARLRLARREYFAGSPMPAYWMGSTDKEDPSLLLPFYSAPNAGGNLAARIGRLEGPWILWRYTRVLQVRKESPRD